MGWKGGEDCGILDHKVVETRGCGETGDKCFRTLPSVGF